MSTSIDSKRECKSPMISNRILSTLSWTAPSRRCWLRREIVGVQALAAFEPVLSNRRARRLTPSGSHWRIAYCILLIAAVVCLSTRTAKCDEEEFEAVVAAEGLLGPADPQMQILARYARVNCALARRVCKLSDEQEKQLAALDDAWLKAECEKLLKAPKENAAAGFARIFGFAIAGQAPVRAVAQPEQIIGMVSQEIDKKIKSSLNEEQAKTFKNELDARIKFRRDSHAEVIVGILDKRLFLTDDQRLELRAAIAGSLGKDVAWSIYLMNENYLPTISRSAIAKVLDKEQLAALSQWSTADFESFQFEQQVMGQQEQFVIEK